MSVARPTSSGSNRAERGVPLAAWPLRDRFAIVGIGETQYCRAPGSGLTLLGLQLHAAVRAIDDAGLSNRQIDGLMPFPGLGNAEEFAANLGTETLRYAATVNMGGAAPVASLQGAAAAVTSFRLEAGITGCFAR